MAQAGAAKVAKTKIFAKEEGDPAGGVAQPQPGEKDVFPFVTLRGIGDVRAPDHRRRTGFTKPCDGVWQDAESIIS